MRSLGPSVPLALPCSSHTGCLCVPPNPSVFLPGTLCSSCAQKAAPSFLLCPYSLRSFLGVPFSVWPPATLSRIPAPPISELCVLFPFLELTAISCTIVFTSCLLSLFQACTLVAIFHLLLFPQLQCSQQCRYRVDAQ